MADKDDDDWFKTVREKQIKRGSASKDDKDLLALADKLLGGNSQMLVKYNSFPEYEVLKDGKTYRINPETNTAEEIKSNDKLDSEIVDDEEDELYDQMESMGDMPSDMQLHKALKKADTNDNGKIEVDEMADFQKSLDDYAKKNPKGREDIPATYKR